MSGVVVIDLGMGNLRSVAKALEHAGAPRVRVSSTPEIIRRAQRVVFPGQGAMGTCAARLREGGVKDALREAAARVPFLGICLGLQALFEHSDEDGGQAGLALLPGTVRRLPDHDAQGARLKVPHMGWSPVAPTAPHPLWEGVPAGSWFYFVHSYYAMPAASTDVLGVADYGGTGFCAAVARRNLAATQFHPEKSHRAGLTLLGNFLAWDGAR
jgi:imidazole glycerol-phosphate synthase subunit HisH